MLVHELVRNGSDFAAAFAAYENRMRAYVDLIQALVDPEREGPVPDEQLDAAKNGIDLTGLLGGAIGKG
ncbi:hypothetical protein [Caballeronia sp. LZ043]|uniref:hypothetical protein n=1 Tax=Caballeronia sp. LZ043 TaxID=3038569 RepID=UPI00285D07C5|nr:hypothetical protein [Caballeronia sp. LZ043]MDR5822670.1 hypothetical protein [Caballeronia sp. LZ043]